VKYQDIRSQIKSGDVIAFSHGGWDNIKDIEVSIVRMATESDYSHVGVALVFGGRVFIVEAVEPLVRIFPLSKLTPFYYLKTSFVWTDDAETTLLERVGYPYSKVEAIKAFFTTDTNSETVWECAKLVNRTLMSFDKGFDALHDTPTDTVKYLISQHNCSIQYIEA
jgi:hypothetical protein